MSLREIFGGGGGRRLEFLEGWAVVMLSRDGINGLGGGRAVVHPHS